MNTNDNASPTPAEIAEVRTVLERSFEADIRAVEGDPHHEENVAAARHSIDDRDMERIANLDQARAAIAAATTIVVERLVSSWVNRHEGAGRAAIDESLERIRQSPHHPGRFSPL